MATKLVRTPEKGEVWVCWVGSEKRYIKINDCGDTSRLPNENELTFFCSVSDVQKMVTPSMVGPDADHIIDGQGGWGFAFSSHKHYLLHMLSQMMQHLDSKKKVLQLAEKLASDSDDTLRGFNWKLIDSLNEVAQ